MAKKKIAGAILIAIPTFVFLYSMTYSNTLEEIAIAIAGLVIIIILALMFVKGIELIND